MDFGSRLGLDNRIILRPDSRQKPQPPAVSSLERLLAYPKKIVDEEGSFIAYEGLEYPLSAFEAAISRQRELRKSNSNDSLSSYDSNLPSD